MISDIRVFPFERLSEPRLDPPRVVRRRGAFPSGDERDGWFADLAARLLTRQEAVRAKGFATSDSDATEN